MGFGWGSDRALMAHCLLELRWEWRKKTGLAKDQTRNKQTVELNKLTFLFLTFTSLQHLNLQ